MRLKDLVSGIHLLPFFPSSSDDGFAVIDYRAVDPAYGDWDDIETLGKRYRLMFDAVINHVSAESQWFQAFLRGDAEYSDYFIRDRRQSRSFEGRPTPLSAAADAFWGTRRG